MTRIRTKSQLIALLEEYASRRAIQRAIFEGKIELLGWFTPAPGSFKPGWALEVTSKHGLKWNVVISIGITGILHSYVIDKIDWEHYTGGVIPLFAGDNPGKYSKLRCEAHANE